MVSNITSLSHNGLRDWFVQRISAVIMTIYFLFLIIHLFITGFDLSSWQNLFSYLWMKIFTLLVFFSLALHAWIGVWTISTDYLDSTGIRITFQTIIALALFGYLIWAIKILWG